MDSPETGTIIAGRYELRAVIGAGGMGVVWFARDTLLDRDVAVKEVIWPPQLGTVDRDALRERALREARTAARLDHPNIVGVYDVAESGGRPWIVMQFIPYRSLSDAVRDDGPVTPAQAAQIGLQILAGIRAAHSAGILHRDIKPGNVLFGPDGRVVLTDFGLAVADGSSTLTTAGVLMGSPSYMAPERVRGERATVAADLWSLGATLYAVAEGHPPFDRDGPMAVLTAVVHEDPDPPGRAGPLWPVISELLSKDPRARPAAADVERMLIGVSQAATPERTRPEVMAPSDRQGRAGLAFIPGFGPRTAEPGGERAAADDAAERAGSARQPPAWGAEPEPWARQEAPRRGPARRGWLLAAAGLAAAAVIGIAIGLITGTSPGRQAQQPGRGRAPLGGGHASAGRRAAAPPPGAARPTHPVPRPGSAPPAGPGHSGPAALPPGYSWYHDPTGFSIAVPAGWLVSHDGHLVYIQAPASGIFLLIDQTTHPMPDPLADWRQQEAARIGSYPRYHRIRLQAVHYAQAQRAADWEFTYFRGGQLVHVLNRNVLANAQHAYALYWSTPAGEWDASYHYFLVFAATFSPASAGPGS